jgi:divalent metal cation (Fe/Co/Zn/Cd) transporter
VNRPLPFGPRPAHRIVGLLVNEFGEPGSLVGKRGFAVRNRPGPHDTPDGMNRPHVNSALRVSMLSMIWTLVSSVLAVIIGLRSRTSVLIAFGAVGVVDAIGSATLTYHFLHGLRHGQLSERLERLSHRIVLIGLLVVGSAAVLGGVIRLILNSSRGSSEAGVVLAGASFVVLVALSSRKVQVARRIASDALRSDGHLSAVGAVLAAVTLVGTVVERWLGWHWADAAATVVLGVIAVWLAITTWRDARNSS